MAFVGDIMALWTTMLHITTFQFAKCYSRIRRPSYCSISGVFCIDVDYQIFSYLVVVFGKIRPTTFLCLQYYKWLMFNMTEDWCFCVCVVDMLVRYISHFTVTVVRQQPIIKYLNVSYLRLSLVGNQST